MLCEFFVVVVESWTLEYNNVIILEIRISPFPTVCWGFVTVSVSCVGFCIAVGCLCAKDHQSEGKPNIFWYLF